MESRIINLRTVQHANGTAFGDGGKGAIQWNR
jgi:hypothetical protein